jgi:hypothetical protein
MILFRNLQRWFSSQPHLMTPKGLPSHVEKMEGTLPKKCDSKGKWDNCGLLIPINAHKLP